jgi:hypothetical protein
LLTWPRPAAGAAAAREAPATLELALPAGQYITAVAHCRVARALVAQRRTAEAAPHFEYATPVLVGTRGVPEYRRECLAAAAEFHQRRGEAAEAARLREVLAGYYGTTPCAYARPGVMENHPAHVSRRRAALPGGREIMEDRFCQGLRRRPRQYLRFLVSC